MSQEQPVEMAKAQNALDYAVQIYGHKEFVTAVDIGYKHKAGKRTDNLAVRIHVSRKLPRSSLDPNELIPEEILGVPTDVIEATYRPHSALRETQLREARLDTIQPGTSIAHKDRTAGTLGAIVYDLATGKPCILSNWHVLAGSASAAPGDPILQPGPQDGGRCPEDVIASLGQSILDVAGDAAIAILNGSRPIRAEQLETGVVIHSSRMPIMNEILEKSGRSTGVTQGRVDGLGQYKLQYSVGTVSICGFKIVSAVDGNPSNEELSASRDSGAIWYDPISSAGIGLHIAGEADPNPLSEHAIACYLTRVLSELRVSLKKEEN